MLKDSLRSDDERMRLEAVKILLDRGYGKPAQQVDLSTKTDLGALHLEALKSLNATRTAAVAAAATVDEEEAPTTH